MALFENIPPIYIETIEATGINPHDTKRAKWSQEQSEAIAALKKKQAKTATPKKRTPAKKTTRSNNPNKGKRNG